MNVPAAEGEGGTPSSEESSAVESRAVQNMAGMVVGRLAAAQSVVELV